MIRYTRPDAPESYTNSEAIRKAQKLLEDNNGRADFPDHWGGFKVHFSGAQHGKCGYCEAKVLGDTGAVEHYAPKAGVAKLKERGEELHDLTNVRGRRLEEIHPEGYWWLAYSWENWIFVCNRCNSAWKLTLFPVLEDPHPRPTVSNPHTPLLLHPYDVDPLEHLDISEVGEIQPRSGSIRGLATIETCGLWRESLRNERAHHAARTVVACNELESGIPGLRRSAIERLRADGASDRPFAGTVRSIVRQRLGWDWKEFSK